MIFFWRLFGIATARCFDFLLRFAGSLEYPLEATKKDDLNRPKNTKSVFGE